MTITPLPPTPRTTHRCSMDLSIHATYDEMRCALTLNEDDERAYDNRSAERMRWHEKELRTGIASFEYFSNLCPHALSLKDAYVRNFLLSLSLPLAHAVSSHRFKPFMLLLLSFAVVICASFLVFSPLWTFSSFSTFVISHSYYHAIMGTHYLTIYAYCQSVCVRSGRQWWLEEAKGEHCRM